MHRQCLFALVGLSLLNDVRAATLAPVPGGFQFESISGRPLPVWSGGALLSTDSFSSPAPVISVFNEQGMLARTVIVSIPDANVTAVRCVARGSDGTVIGGGWTSASDGRTASILVIAAPNRATTVIRTDPFAANQLAVAPDGTIWAQGFIGRNPDKIVDPDPAHGVIRHFDSSGKMIGSFIPEATLNNRLREMKGHLSVTSNKVGWVSWVEGADMATAGTYVEILPDQSVHEYPLPVMGTIRGFAITTTGLPVAGVTTAWGRPGSPEQSGLMAFDRLRGAWVALDNQSLAGKSFLGGTGETLAIWDLKTKLIGLFTPR